MKENVNPIPKGYGTVTPSLVIQDCEGAIEFYKKALGAQELMTMNGPDGNMVHAEIRIGNSILMLNPEHGEHPGHDQNCPKTPSEMKGTTSSFYVYVEDADAAYGRAISAGAKSVMPLTDMFWGDRMGNVQDPYGYIWSIATHTKNPTPREMEQGAKEFYAQTVAR